jgi:hypothetical protein
MESAVEILCPSQKHLFSKVSLSGITVARIIDQLAEDIEDTLKDDDYLFVYYSFALNKNCDINDITQLAIFISSSDQKFNITEELAAPSPIIGTTEGCDIADAVLSTF